MSDFNFKPPLFVEEQMAQRKLLTDLHQELHRLQGRNDELATEVRLAKNRLETVEQERDENARERDKFRSELSPLQARVRHLVGVVNQYHEHTQPLLSLCRDAALLADAVPTETAND